MAGTRVKDVVEAEIPTLVFPGPGILKAINDNYYVDPTHLNHSVAQLDAEVDQTGGQTVNFPVIDSLKSENLVKSVYIPRPVVQEMTLILDVFYPAVNSVHSAHTTEQGEKTGIRPDHSLKEIKLDKSVSCVDHSLSAPLVQNVHIFENNISVCVCVWGGGGGGGGDYNGFGRSGRMWV